MTLIVETGAGLATAESYASVPALDAYAVAHGSPATWSAASLELKEAALRYATAWLDGRYEWAGVVRSPSQALAWPRAGATDPDGRGLTGIPPRLVRLTCQAALYHLEESLAAPLARGGAIKREKVGPLEVEYADGAPASRTFSYLDDLAAPLLSSSAGGYGVVRLVRA